MTQLLEARGGKITPEMEFVAQREGLSPEEIQQEIAEGRMVIPANRLHLNCRLGGILVLKTRRAAEKRINVKIYIIISTIAEEFSLHL